MIPCVSVAPFVMELQSAYYPDDDNNSTYYESAYDYLELQAEYVIADAISCYVAPVLLFTGLAGNLLSLLVHLKLGRRHMSTCYYLVVLSVVDPLLVVHRLGNDWARHTFDDLQVAVQNRSELTCQLYNFTASFLLHFSTWLFAIAALDVALAHVYPLRAGKICRSPERVKNVTLTVVLFLVLTNAHFFWTYGLSSTSLMTEELSCTFSSKGGMYADVFRNRVWPIMDRAIGTVSPQAVILVSVVYICRRRRDLSRSSRDDSAATARAVHRSSRTFVALGAASLLLTLPETTYNVFELLVKEEVIVLDNSDMVVLSRRILGQTICFICRDVFIAWKVLLCVGCWPRFRSCAVEIVRCNVIKKTRRRRLDRKYDDSES